MARPASVAVCSVEMHASRIKNSRCVIDAI
jgi:hypothetical protein